MNIVIEQYLFRLFICVIIIIMLFHFFLYLLTYSKAHLIMLHGKLRYISVN